MKVAFVAIVALLLAAFVSPVSASALTLTSGGLDYKIESGGTVTITGCHVGVCPDDMGIVRVPATISRKKVTKIADGAFRNKHFWKVALPSTLLSIGKNAFAGTWIDKVTFPTGLKTIDDGAFATENRDARAPWRVSVITIPASVTFIGNGAFVGFGNQQEFHFLGEPPSTNADNIFGSTPSVRIFAKAAKTGWLGLNHQFSGQAVILDTDDPTPTTWGTQDGLNWRVQQDGTVQIASCTGWSDPDNWGLKTCPLNRYVIPETIDGKQVTRIADSAFKFGRLTSITLPSTITDIGAYAFFWDDYWNTSVYMRSFVLPPHLKTLGDYALLNLVVDSPIDIPESVTSLGRSSLPVSSEFHFLGDAPTTTGSPFTYSDFYLADPTSAATEYITALAAKTGWQSHSLGGKHIVLDTDSKPETPKVTWAVIKESCPEPQTYLVIAVTPVTGVTYKTRISKQLQYFKNVFFGNASRSRLPSNRCLRLSTFHPPSGSIYFSELWSSSLTYSVVPFSSDGARGPAYTISIRGGVRAGTHGGN